MNNHQIYSSQRGDELIRSLVAGDVKAFNQFFKDFYDSLFYYCRHLVHDEEEAKDIVLNAFYKFWERREKIQNYLNAKSFLYLVVKNAGLNYIKQKNRKLTRFREFSLSVELIEHTQDYLEIEAEILERVYREIEKLPKKCREVFELSFLEGKSVAEIAEMLEMSLSNVSSQRYRALQLLKLALRDAPIAFAYLPFAAFLP